MIVLSMTNVPNKIRGDLSKWLLEIETGVYVGNVSSTVRKGLWERINSVIGTGRAVMVWNTNNEQGYDFIVSGSNWLPSDYDGLKLLLHPILDEHVITEKAQNIIQKNNSLYKLKYQKAGILLHDYVVVDIVTTGDNIFDDVLLEICALKIKNHKKNDSLQICLNHNGKISNEAYLKNSIDRKLVDGKSFQEKDAVIEFLNFMEDLPMVGFDVDFCVKFIKYACQRNEALFPRYKLISILNIVRRLLDNGSFNSLWQVAENLQVGSDNLNHNDLSYCVCCYNVYEKILDLLGFNKGM